MKIKETLLLFGALAFFLIGVYEIIDLSGRALQEGKDKNAASTFAFGEIYWVFMLMIILFGGYMLLKNKRLKEEKEQAALDIKSAKKLKKKK